ncbi:hypothetical protein [Burkholderia stagnalis]|uniref:hypothetical protein n=1 Tax=Burkholderia stagnalis TaxID=1503054 RepID=UPI000F5BD681|nr:hypothetical protein [Burkholderia stagnalis]RQP98879.1 hypothetical protein DF164_31235 [Burkholderia stagnalis]RQY64931.1 hypothetical protein DF110_30760 [Burkholderia stagnalis]
MNDAAANGNAQALAVPPDWGADELTGFFQLAARNAYASFVQPATRPYFERLRAIDGTFMAAIGVMRADPDHLGEPLMLVNAHAAFRAAAELALQTRTCEAYVLMRSCLEYALYAVHFHRHPESFEVWARRGEGEPQRKAVRRAFRPHEMLDGVVALHNAIGARAKHLYEFSIDMGAHPNETGIFGRLRLEQRPDGERELQTRYLHPGDVAIRATLKAAAQVGVCTLECFWLIYRERFDIMGIKEAIDAHKPGL